MSRTADSSSPDLHDSSSFPPAPHMRCVSRFSSWSSLHSSRPSSERACCNDSDNDGEDEDDFLDSTKYNTSRTSEPATITTPESFPDSQSPTSSAPDHPSQDSDSGYGSPPAKSSYLANPSLPEQTLLPSFSPGESWQSARSSWPRVPPRLNMEEEAIEIVAVPANSLTDCSCRICSAPQERVNVPSERKDEHEIVISQYHQDGTSSIPPQYTSQLRRTSGWNLKGLRIWTPSRSKARQQR